MVEGHEGAAPEGAMERLIAGRWSDGAERDALLRAALGSASVEGLVQMLLVPDEEVRRAAMVRLKRVGGAAMVDALLLAAPEHPEGEVLAAVELLALIAPPGSVQRASVFLGHGSAASRAAAEAFVLAGGLDRDVLPVVLGWLASDSAAPRSLRVLELLRRDLRAEELRQPEVLRALERTLLHAEVQVRQSAYRLLAQAEAPEAAQALISRLTAEEEALRPELMQALRQALLGAPPARQGEVVAPLLAALDGELRRSAVRLLAGSGEDAAGVLAAWRVIEQLPPWLQGRAAGALREGLPRWEAGLIAALRGGSVEEACRVIHLLRSVGEVSPGLLAALGERVRGGEESLRWHGAWALAALGDASSASLLASSWRERGEPATLWALGRLGARLLAEGEEDAGLGALQVLADAAGGAGAAGLREGVLASLGEVRHPVVLGWLEELARMEQPAAQRLRALQAARWLREALGVPPVALGAVSVAERGSGGLQGLVAAALEQGATGLSVAPGRTPQMEVGGRWVALPEQSRRAAVDVSRLLREAMPDAVAATLAAEGQVSWLPPLEGVVRAEGCVGREGVSGLLRLRAQAQPGLHSLGLSAYAPQLEASRSGLILVASSLGGGRSTTLGALVEQLARTRQAQVALLGAPWEGAALCAGAALLTPTLVSTGDAAVAAAVVAAREAGAGIVALDVEPGPQARQACLEVAQSGALVLVSTSCWRRAALLERWEESATAGRLELSGLICMLMGQLLLAGAPGEELAAVEVCLPPPPGHPSARWLELARVGVLPEGGRSMQAALRAWVEAGRLDGQRAEAALSRWMMAQSGSWRSWQHVQR